jgi:ectoine hydroxylase-related dioxygenase (phytanoyl-CoA dioxygenase family)
MGQADTVDTVDEPQVSATPVDTQLTPELTVELTSEQIERFHVDGYLSIPALTTPQDVAELCEIYDRLFKSKAGRELGLQLDLAGLDDDESEAVLPQILEPQRFAPELNDSLLLRNARLVAKQLFGPDASCEFFHAIFKPALIGAETPWHQDASYWPADLDFRSASIWVPLQEATLDNGCMQFVPGSHVAEVVHPHRSLNDDNRIHANELRPELLHLVEGAVACPLNAGGATFHGGYTLHYTGPNRSATPRRAIILYAGEPPTKRSAPRDLPWMRAKMTERAKRAKGASTAAVPL